jgi:hypothetical protein
MTAVYRMWWWLVAILSIGVALVSLRYLVGRGPLAENVLANAFAAPWLTIHVAGGATALLVGAFQFIPGLRATGVHRWSGRLYVVACLVGGSAGLALALGSTAGAIATAGFGGLAVAWVVTNAQGWRFAVRRDFVSHRRWMIRSWSLTHAAVTLRLYLPLLDPLGVPFFDGYRAISFLCWVPNLAIAELYLARESARAFRTSRA